MRLTLRSFAAFCEMRLTHESYRENRATYSCKFENFSCEVLEDSSDVDGSFRTDTHLVLSVVLQETLDTTTRELLMIELASWLGLCALHDVWTPVAFRH